MTPAALAGNTRRRALCALSEWLAVLLLGTMAGFFFAFAVDVAPAMAGLDAEHYVRTQQAINRVVRNAVFGGAYFGSALMPWLAALAALACGRRRRALAWMLIALVYGVAVFWLTRSVNVPINDELARWSADAVPAHWAELRERWNAANLVRCVAALLCFGAAAALHRRCVPHFTST